MKITTTELKIGNLVEYNGMHLRVSEIYSPKTRQPKKFDGVECVELLCDGFITATMDEVKPVPLTEEILLKCGFVEDCAINEDQDEHYFWTNPNVEWILDDFYQPMDAGFKMINYELEYLHQLQNLYYTLTGQELQCIS